MYILPGANPAIVSYNASVVKILSSVSSLVRFENKNNSSFWKYALFYHIPTYNAGVVFVGKL
jgi:hypothetical protein